MLVTPVCFPGLVVALFWLLNKALKVLELCAPLAKASLDRYPLFQVVWQIIMYNGPSIIFPSLILNLTTNYAAWDGTVIDFSLAVWSW